MQCKKKLRTCAVLGIAVSSLTAGASGEGKMVTIPVTVPFAEGSQVQFNIKRECKLPTEVSNEVRTSLSSAGYHVRQSGDLSKAQGAVLRLEISEGSVAVGNAFVGRRASMEITGKLVVDGKPLGSFTGYRDTNGGFLGAYKTSCAVVLRCAGAIGADIAKWMEHPTENALLGDQPKK